MNCQLELRTSHLIIPPNLVEELLDEYATVYVSYKKDLGAILVSPKSNSWFPKLHESLELMVKNKDLHGTKSVSIREVLIDHDIDSSDKMFSATINKEKRILKIEL
ncbi:hypothetical protein [Ekhidna sp.]|uniref:hypothetical protein n=1 Tax=Ekhidna sp. TaxID=2608089 RepID=UPI00329A02F4